MEFIIIGIAIGLSIPLTWLDIYFGKKRIQASAERLGYKDIKIKWEPFAPGALFSRGHFFYVSYTDKDGDHRFSYCKTSFLTGVYWRNDKDVYAGNSCLVTLVFYLLFFLGLCGGIALAIQWVR